MGIVPEKLLHHPSLVITCSVFTESQALFKFIPSHLLLHPSMLSCCIQRLLLTALKWWCILLCLKWLFDYLIENLLLTFYYSFRTYKTKLPLLSTQSVKSTLMYTFYVDYDQKYLPIQSPNLFNCDYTDMTPTSKLNVKSKKRCFFFFLNPWHEV